MSYTREQWQSKYKTLPETLRDAITSEETTDALSELAESKGLHIDEIGKVSNIVTATFFGDIKAHEISLALQKELGVDELKAKMVAEHLNEKIFLPIRQELKKLYTEKSADELHPLPANKGEAKTQVLSAIEEPEKIPMKVRVIEPVVAAPTPVAPAVAPVPPPAPAPKPAPALQQIEQPLPTATATPVAPAPQPAQPLKKATVPVRDPNTPDPYREAAK